MNKKQTVALVITLGLIILFMVSPFLAYYRMSGSKLDDDFRIGIQMSFDSWE